MPTSPNTGGGWGDPLNGECWFGGSQFDGTGSTGPCVVNCTNDRGRGVYSFHTGGANAVFADGTVHFLKATIDVRILAGLITRAGGEVLGSGW